MNEASRGQTEEWIGVNWFYAGLTAALFLVALAPLLWKAWSLPLFAVFLQLPVYMVHQVEEHHQDRFRRFVNQLIAAGREALTTRAVLVINLGGVWGVDLLALYLARFVQPGLGLIAVYLAIVNGILHVLGAAIMRAYNPGLVTAILLLLPAGCWGMWMLVRSGACTAMDHGIALGISVAIHVGTIAHVRLRAIQTQA